MINHFMYGAENFDLFVRLGAAMLCGMMIGTERVISHKSAGMRTYALVAMGAALFATVGDLVIGSGLTAPLIAGIVSGIGFMGAGVIIFKDTNVTGLTTASGLWVAAGIGIACGFKLYALAVIATLLSLFVFLILFRLEQVIRYFNHKYDHNTPEQM